MSCVGRGISLCMTGKLSKVSIVTLKSADMAGGLCHQTAACWFFDTRICTLRCIARAYHVHLINHTAIWKSKFIIDHTIHLRNPWSVTALVVGKIPFRYEILF